MFCPHCKNKLYSEVLKTCPFCGLVIEVEHDNGKTSKKVSVSHFVPGFKKLPEKENKTTETRGIGTNFSTGPEMEDIEAQRPALKKFDLDESAPLKREEWSKPEMPHNGAEHKTMKNSSPEAVSPDSDPFKSPVGSVKDEPLSSPTVEEEKKLDEGGKSSVPIVESIEKPVECNEKKETVSLPVSDLNKAAIQEKPPTEQEEKESPVFQEVPKKERKGIFTRRTKKNSLDNQETIDSAAEEKSFKRNIGLFGRKQKEKKSDNNSDTDEQPVEETTDEENLFDTNIDGYYDDLIPELAKQINKMPQENLIKAVLLVLFGITAIIITIVTS